jgi:hypothetical protein
MIGEKFRDQLNEIGNKVGAHYLLKDREPVRVEFFEWLEAMGERDGITEHLWQTDVGDAKVSTIFVGFAARPGWPLFETMIFGGPLDLQQWRYATYAEAEAGHAAAVQAAQG